MFQVLIGFIPWIIYWSLSGPGWWSAAILGGLISAIGLVTWRYLRKGNFKTMEVVTAGYFLAHAVLTLALGSSFLKIYGPIVNSLVLAGMAFGTLAAKNPFTYQYAKEDWDKSYWESEPFIKINQTITAVWGVIFLLNSGLGALGIFVFPAYGFWLSVVVSNLLIVSGIVFSARFPKNSVRRDIQQMLDARNPYKWARPKFGGRPVGENEQDVIVIGAGLGGLSAAALLAKRGLKVAVFEQHYLAGGYCTSWQRGVRVPEGQGGPNARWEYTFDAGVHDVSGLGERGGVRSLLRMLDIENAIEWRLNEQEYFRGGIHLKIPHEAGEFARQLGGQFPAEAGSILKFFDEMLLVYREMYADIEKTGGAPRMMDSVEDLVAYPQTHPHAYRWMERPFAEMLDEYFKDARLKEFLSSLTGYLSDDPRALTVGHMAPIFGYHFDGGYYPVGGSQALPDALVRVIEENGGKVFLRTPVQRILVENGRAAGIELKDGRRVSARAVLSNADVQKTFLDLVGKDQVKADFYQTIQDLKPSTSAFMVFLGVDMVPDLAPITMMDDLGIMIPSKVDGSLAPGGHASVSLLKLLPQAEAGDWDRKAPGYAQRKRALADEMIDAAEEIIPGLRAHITYRQEASPATFARYAWTSGGSIYGPATGQGSLHIKTPIRNLYLAGSAVMGGGVEAAVIAGIHAANEIHPN